MTAIRDLMGHSSLTVTSRYLHSKAEQLRATTALLPSLGKRQGGDRVGTKDGAKKAA